DVGTLVGRQRGPGPLRPGGGLRRSVHVLVTPAGDLVHHLAVGGVLHLVRLTGRRPDALALDDHGLGVQSCPRNRSRPTHGKSSSGRCAVVTPTKLAASSMLPDPAYLACCGYANTGRVRTTAPVASLCVATIFAGASPRSTQCVIGLMRSNWVGPKPPPQWYMDGNMNSRANSWTDRRPPIRSCTAA